MTRAFRLLFAALCIWWLAVVAIYGFAISARAHSFYDPWCCNQRDCQPIPAHAVEIVPEGYRVTLKPGEHHMVNETVVHVVPFSEARDAPDGAYHACLYPTQHVMRCFYRPPGLS